MPGKRSRKGTRHCVTMEEMESLLRNHLSICYNRRRHLVEIGWVCKCRDKRCNVPHTSVTFSVCPYPPCPPG